MNFRILGEENVFLMSNLLLDFHWFLYRKINILFDIKKKFEFFSTINSTVGHIACCHHLNILSVGCTFFFPSFAKHQHFGLTCTNTTTRRFETCENERSKEETDVCFLSSVNTTTHRTVQQYGTRDREQRISFACYGSSKSQAHTHAQSI